MDAETTPDDGIVVVEGRKMMIDDRGAYVPLETVKPLDKLMDELVRKLFAYAEPLSAQVARFFGHCMDDIGGFEELIAQEYQLTRRGKKGNRTYTSFDGLRKVQLQVADRIGFGPELQAAKSLVDTWLIKQTAEATPELQAFVLRAFDVDKQGRVNQAELLRLRRLDIRDSTWTEAMRAISDAIRPQGTKQYIRFYRRAATGAPWEAITIDLAQV